MASLYAHLVEVQVGKAERHNGMVPGLELVTSVQLSRLKTKVTPVLLVRPECIEVVSVLFSFGVCPVTTT